jgi:2,3-bisphosphoglycerate-dependent phosphoglycerate mutase
MGANHRLDQEAGMATATLVIMRHGESAWTDKRVNKFAGWVDVPLTDRGRAQAAEAGRLMREAHILPDAVFTSLLGRSIVSADIALGEVGRLWVPVIRSWRLNERHYGAFQGQTRPAMREQYGDELFNTYRRSFDVRPPAIALDSPYFQGDDPRYGTPSQDGLDGTDPRAIRSECLKDVIARLEPFWGAYVTPPLLLGQTVLVVTHGSVVRSLMKVIEGLTADQIRNVNVPTGQPRVYEFEAGGLGGLSLKAPGRWLDPDAASRGARETLALGESNPA